jgi:light-regulated signal transduction histidine kinase (bacteriophytochrome)
LVRVDRKEALQVIAVVEDITSRKKTEADLIRSNTDLELYASIAAHDLQEPVRKVITYGEILTKMSDCLPLEGRAALERSIHSALRMKELIEDLLEYSRVNSVKRASAPVDLNVVLKEVLADLEITIAERSGRIEVGPLPVVNADALQMRQLFQNLISNAVKFTEPGQPPDVTVSAELLDGMEVRIEVKDKGIGFDEKFLDRIFRPFQRVCDKNMYEGSGIGLAICKSVVQRHGGSITAVSAPGKGACFCVTLPVCPRVK